MNDIERILRAQAEGQRRLRDLSWPDKVKMAEQARDTVVTLRHARTIKEGSGAAGATPTPGRERKLRFRK